MQPVLAEAFGTPGLISPECRESLGEFGPGGKGPGREARRKGPGRTSRLAKLHIVVGQG
jgi:hypothetical protein